MAACMAWSGWPCTQNILLSGRAVGLGASLATIHHMFEEEFASRLGVPDDVSLVALLPMGFPHGRFGPVTRKPAQQLTRFDRWGSASPGDAEACDSSRVST
jgi:nitroreductase